MNKSPIERHINLRTPQEKPARQETGRAQGRQDRHDTPLQGLDRQGRDEHSPAGDQLSPATEAGTGDTDVSAASRDHVGSPTGQKSPFDTNCPENKGEKAPASHGGKCGARCQTRLGSHWSASGPTMWEETGTLLSLPQFPQGTGKDTGSWPRDAGEGQSASAASTVPGEVACMSPKVRPNSSVPPLCPLCGRDTSKPEADLPSAALSKPPSSGPQNGGEPGQVFKHPCPNGHPVRSRAPHLQAAAPAGQRWSWATRKPMLPPAGVTDKRSNCNSERGEKVPDCSERHGCRLEPSSHCTS